MWCIVMYVAPASLKAPCRMCFGKVGMDLQGANTHALHSSEAEADPVYYFHSDPIWG